MGKILRSLAVCLCGFLWAAGLLTSCNSGGCTDLRSAVPRADFYSSATLSAITVDSLQITGIGAPGDSVLYGPSSRISSVYLPMPAEVDKVSWRFAYMQSFLAAINLADTVSLSFDRTPWFAGEECGAMYKYKIKEVSYTTNIIDSVGIADSVVVNIEQATLNIYFRTE